MKVFYSKGIIFLKVVGGPNDSIIFVTLGPGVCFGEIALLGTGGMNRRTASIKVAMEILKCVRTQPDIKGPPGHVMSCFYLKGKITVSQAHGFTTLFVLFKWDLQAAMKDYPEDQALLSR